MGAIFVAEECMKVLVKVECVEDIKLMERLLCAAGINGKVSAIFDNRPKSKPPMKELRKLKYHTDEQSRDYDYIIASGETAARLVLDKSVVNISRVRGRDFEYEMGVKGKK
jgi:uracil-DNA glycosylase